MSIGKRSMLTRQRKSLSAVAALACVIVTTFPAARADDDDRAHAIAERFAGATEDARKADEARKRAEAERLKAVKAAAEAKRKSEDAKRHADAARLKAQQMKADEADMLERARAEAAEREAEQMRAQAELERAEEARLAREKELAEDARRAADAAAAAERARIEAARMAAEASERESAEKARIEKARLEKERADEVARAKAEADEKARREAQLAADQLASDRAAALEAEKRAAEQKSIAEAAERAKAALAEARQAQSAQEANKKAELEREAAREAESARQALETEREQEAMRLTEKIRKARDAREARQTAGSEPVTSTPDAPAGGVIHAARGTAAPAAPHRVTVLLMLSAGNKGIRRWNKSADPMLCVAEVCYVSAGASVAAKRLPRSTAFGPGVALGSRAGACNNSLGCVFRDVDLEAASALVQPIDLRIVRHDRREASEARADDSCAVAGGKLDCRSGVSSSTWRAWIVPEKVAAAAGSDSLEAALASGLPVQEASVRGDR